MEPVTVLKHQKNKNHNMDISENHTDNKYRIFIYNLLINYRFRLKVTK